MLFKTNSLIGYAQLYFKIVGKNETYYAAFDGDFGKPLTWFRLHSIKRSMRKAYEKFDKIYSVDFCSKEEWKEKQCGDEISCSLGDYEGTSDEKERRESVKEKWH